MATVVVTIVRAITALALIVYAVYAGFLASNGYHDLLMEGSGRVVYYRLNLAVIIGIIPVLISAAWFTWPRRADRKAP